MRSFVFLGLAIAAVSAEAQYGSHGAPSEKMDDKMMYGHAMPHMEYQEPAYARPHEYQEYREPHYMPHMEHGYERRQHGYQKPKYTTPKPTYRHPEPAYEHPEPAYGRHEPAYNHPNPAYKHPEPAYERPKPGYKQPEPAYEHPEPKHEPAYSKPPYGDDSRNYHYQSYHMPGYNHHMFQEPDTQTYMNHMTYHDHKSYDHMPHTKQTGYRPEPSYTTPRPYHPTTYKPTPEPYKPTPEPYKPTPRHYGPTPKPYRPNHEPYGPTPKPYAPTHARYNHYRPTPSPYHTTTYRPYHAQSKSYEYEMPEPYMPYEEEKPARPAYNANAYAPTTPKYAKEMMMDDHMEKETGVAPYSPPKSPAKPEPKYLGKFQHPTHEVEGDIFQLDDHTLYIQGFSFDGGAPDVVFYSDGVAIPYYTRSNPQMAVNVKKFNKEDVVLMLPPEKPTLKDLRHFQVWCRQFEQDFGEFVMI